MRFILALLVNGLIIFLSAYVFSGIQVAGYKESVIAALFLAIVNFLIRPILTFLTLPITILTLGLFLLVVNGAMVLLVDWLLDGFNVEGLFWAVILSLILAVSNTLISSGDD